MVPWTIEIHGINHVRNVMYVGLGGARNGGVAVIADEYFRQ